MFGYTLRARRGRLPVIHQAEAAECGLACLAMVAGYYGYHVDLNEMRHRFRISLKGVSLKDVVHFARALGLSSRALRAEPSQLGRIRCPAIMHVDMNHFVVLKEMRGNEAIVHDPAIGVRRLTAEQVDRKFTGIVLELSPTLSFETKPPRPRMRLGSLAKGINLEHSAWVKALLLSAFLQMLVLTAPLYVQLVVDQGIGQNDTAAIATLAIGFFLLLALRVAFACLRVQILLALSALLSAGMMARIVGHMLRLPSSWFATRQVSMLLSRLTSADPIRDLLTQGLIGVIVDGALFVVTLAVAALFAPKLALIVLFALACAGLLKWVQVRLSLPHEHDFLETTARAQQEFIETVRAIATIRLFGKEADREAGWRQRHVEAVNSRFRLDRVRMMADAGRDGIQALAVILVVLVGAAEVISGRMSIGTLMAFLTYQQMFGTSAATLLDFAGRLRLLDVHLERIADVMLEPPEADEFATQGNIHARLEGRVEARKVSFRYADLDEPVLTNISFDVAPGEFVAITGPSGGGKTTFLKLLVGLLDPSDGQILYDDRLIQVHGRAALRAQIGVVMQDDVLLSGSLGQNITFFDSSPDHDWMRECARLAAIDEDISRFPMAYNTLVGDMGTVLSGGQRQRVLLARALYRRPRILFIDEGTSSLDTEREREVNANLQSLSMTRIIIAHRKDTIAAADRILELSAAGLHPRDVPTRTSIA